MLGLSKLWNAIGTLTANLQALAQTVADVNAGVRSRLQLDAQDIDPVQAPALPGQVLDHQADGEPIASNSTSKRTRKALAD